MDYNTQREKLLLPEYGRNIKGMVDYAMTIQDREERLQCARKIVATMAQIFPKDKQKDGHEQMLWDHLALISNYKLDIDWPYEITRADEISRPAPMDYPQAHINVRHYGHLIEELVQKVIEMEDGEEKLRLIELLANQMRKDLYYWNKSSLNEQRIADDIYRMSKGRIYIEDGQIAYTKNMPSGNGGKSNSSNAQTGKRSKKSK